MWRACLMHIHNISIFLQMLTETQMTKSVFLQTHRRMQQNHFDTQVIIQVLLMKLYTVVWLIACNREFNYKSWYSSLCVCRSINLRDCSIYNLLFLLRQNTTTIIMHIYFCTTCFGSPEPSSGTCIKLLNCNVTQSVDWYMYLKMAQVSRNM
jgi:hypothetical protein